MDDAFLPLSEIIASLVPFREELVDEESGVRSYVMAYEIDCPVELELSMNDKQQFRIGSTPPIYYVDTSFRPSYHRIRFVAVRSGEASSDAE